MRYDNGNMEERENSKCERERRKEIGIKNKETVVSKVSRKGRIIRKPLRYNM